MLLLLLATVLLAGGAATAQQNLYYETLFVGNGIGPFANEVAVLSAWEQFVGGAGIWMGGLFADFNTSANPANAIHCAALDSSVAGTVPGSFHPTGSLVVAKNIGAGAGVNGFETYTIGGTGGEVNPTHLNYLGSQEWSPTPVSFLTPSASGNPIQAMDIANGFLPVVGQMPMITDFVVSAEVIGGQIWLGTYAMTNPLGIPVQPFFVNSTNTMQAGPCQGLTTSNGKVGTGPRSRNDIVFVDGNNIVHGQTFEISAATFPFPLDTNTAYPRINPPNAGWQLPVPGTIAGIWICQIPGAALAHNVGISFLGASGNPNALYIVHDQTSPNSQTGLFWHAVSPFGGGPICHIPTGLTTTQTSPSYWALFGPPPGTGAAITGWFVANAPTPPGVQWTLEGIDASGVRPGLYLFSYTPGWVPNGTPLSDPSAIGFLPLPPPPPPPPPQPVYQPGLVWVPETNGPNSQIHLVGGVGAPPMTVATFSHSIATANHTGLGPLPLPPSTPWPATQILQDQKTNSKADYGLFMAGY